MAEIVNNMSILPQAATPNTAIYTNTFDRNRETYARNKQMYQQLGIAMRNDELAVADDYKGTVPRVWNETIGRLQHSIDEGDFIGIDGAIDDAAFKYATDQNLINAKYNTTLRQQFVENLNGLLFKGDTSKELADLLQLNQPLPQMQEDGTIEKAKPFNLGAKYYNPQDKINKIMAITGKTIQKSLNVKIDPDSLDYDILGQNDEVPQGAKEIESDLLNGKLYVDKTNNKVFFKYDTTQTGGLDGGYSMISTIGARDQFILAQLVNDDQVIGYYQVLAEERNKAGRYNRNGDKWTAKEILLGDVQGLAIISSTTESTNNRIENLNSTGAGNHTSVTPTPKGFTLNVSLPKSASDDGFIDKSVATVITDEIANRGTAATDIRHQFESSEVELQKAQDAVNEFKNQTPKDPNTYKQQLSKLENDLLRLKTKRDKLAKSSTEADAAWKVTRSKMVSLAAKVIDEDPNIERYGNSPYSVDAANKMRAILDDSMWVKVTEDGDDLYEGLSDWMIKMGFTLPTNKDVTMVSSKINEELSEEIYNDLTRIINNYLPTSKELMLDAIRSEYNIDVRDPQQALEQYIKTKFDEYGLPENISNEKAAVAMLANKITMAINPVISEYRDITSESLMKNELLSFPTIAGVDEVKDILGEILSNNAVAGYDIFARPIATKGDIGDRLRAILGDEDAEIQATLDSYSGRIGVIVSLPAISTGNNQREAITEFMYLDEANSQAVINRMLQAEDLTDDQRSALQLATLKDENGVYMTDYVHDYKAAANGSSNISNIYSDDIDLPTWYDWDETTGDYKYNDEYSKTKRAEGLQGIPIGGKAVNWYKVDGDTLQLQILGKSSADGKIIAQYIYVNNEGKFVSDLNRPTASTIVDGNTLVNGIDNALFVAYRYINGINKQTQ